MLSWLASLLLYLKQATNVLYKYIQQTVSWIEE